MPSRETTTGDINAQSPRGSRDTQRERLLAGMLAVANRDGYANANVSAVIAHAGVSRPTFYEYFTDKDDCFLAVHRDIAERLLEQIQDALEQAPPEHAPQTAMRRLLQRAEAEPSQAQFLANDTLAAGPRALDERDRTITRIERLIEDARADTPPRAPSPDLPTKALIGATHWLLAQRLRHSEHDLTQLADELTQWIETYNQPTREHRWRTLQPGPSPGPSPHVSEIPTAPPAPIPAGRTRLSKTEIAQNQRWRILFATADTAAAKGYTATTVTDIAKAARLDKRVFYKHFRDKQQAFLAVHELAFQQAMAVAASAYFSAEEWPERIWRGIHAATQFQGTHAGIAHMGFVESHALGPTAIQLIENNHAAFTIFLQEGNQHTTTPPPPIAPQAIAAAIFELAYQQTRHSNPHHLTHLTYPATYLALTPYLTPQAANQFIEGKLKESTTAAPSAPA
jgi:AcrR family transcriptional regulator